MYSPALARTLTFSKQDFANSRGCAGFAWLAIHQPHLVPADDMDAAARRERTHAEVALAARDLFPGGVAVDATDPDAAIAATAQAIAAGASTLFNATVYTDRGLLATADVLVRTGDQWMLGEVKATGGIKGDHIADLAYQAAVFAEAGIVIAETRLILLQKAYRRRGAVEPGQLFETHDVTARVRRRLPAVEREITVALAATRDPDRPASCLCDMGTRSQRCPAFGHFHPDVPGTGTVYDLGSVTGDLLGKVLARGVSSLADWPDDIAVSARQRRQIDVHREGAAHVDAGALEEFLDRLEYPLHFLDYETFQTAIPMFDGCWPWVQIPFQYSLHIVAESGTCDHRSFLWTEPRQFPVPALLERAQADIGERGSVVVWNRGFEQSRNREMAEMVPAAAGFLEQVNDRMVDLMDIVRLGAWVDPAFNGSASLKKVLPVADPDLSYAALTIGDGAAASARWFDAVMGDPAAMAAEERAAMFEALRAYCHLDTLGMVRILYHVRSLVGWTQGPLATR